MTGAQAVGQPDRRAGEIPVAYVTLADGTVGEDELRAWAAAHVSEAAAAPKAVRVLDALPVTAVGKPYKLRCARTPPAVCWPRSSTTSRRSARTPARGR
ncbi:hypothetical protein O1M54_14320 [Streptomyces diastatochromogenes]|nr:hypothetical protein [Streptomyces diastatochromogenes]